MNQFIVFSKLLHSKSIDQLIDIALEYDFDGYDLCVRPNHPVNPDNVTDALPSAARKMAQAGLVIPMVTGNFDLLTPEQPSAESILMAMDAADIRLIKLGYFQFDPHTQGYWQEVDRIRRAFESWQTLGRRYGVKICYHTHNGRCMGLNAAALMHLIDGFDPQVIGAYLDTTHLILEGEEFAVAMAMVKKYLSIIALKDVLKFRVERNGHGAYAFKVTPAGEGMVDWTAVFSDLSRFQYGGPLSLHCEWEDVAESEFMDRLRREVAFFKSLRESFLAPGALA